MSKVTFVVDFENGKEPAVHSRMNILGGELAAVAWRDAIKSEVVSVKDGLPAPNQQCLLFDANGEGWVIGWRSVWLSECMTETGDWDWSYQIESLAHWTGKSGYRGLPFSRPPAYLGELVNSVRRAVVSSARNGRLGVHRNGPSIRSPGTEPLKRTRTEN